MNKNNTSSTWQALGLAFQLGYTIAIPAVVFALIGRVLDKKYNTTPLLLIIGLLIALILSSISVFKKANAIMKETTDKIQKNTNDSELNNNKE